MNSGKVYLVGAGPGDIGLLTLKGKEILNSADVVVYDNLVGDEIIASIPKSALLVNVGKRAGRHSLPQDEINRVLVKHAKEGKTVIRLKGGDPFVFGRGAEELCALSDEGIPFEIVPGVTAAVSVPAYSGIPATHRDFASSVHIIAGHKRAGSEFDIDFEPLIKAKGTLVFLMGLTALSDIMNGLLRAGMDPGTPAAVISRGTTAAQKTVIADIKTLVSKVKEQGLETPATIVVGDVCRYAEKFAWRDSLPLSGRKIIVTRPEERSSEIALRLRRAGAEVLALPSVSLRKIENNERLRRSIEKLEGYDWLVFTSAAGVRFLMEELFDFGRDARSLSKAKIACIGKATASELKKYALRADLVPDEYNGKALGQALLKNAAENSRILISRSSSGSDEIIKTLALRDDIKTDDIAIYDTVYEEIPMIGERRLFENDGIDCVIFTSASTVRGFALSAQGLDFAKIRAVCIGEITARQAAEYGMKVHTSKKATVDSLIELVISLFAE